MLTLLTRWFKRPASGFDAQESEWVTVRLPRVGRKRMSFEQAEARLVLGGLRLGAVAHAPGRPADEDEVRRAPGRAPQPASSPTTTGPTSKTRACWR